MAYFEQWQEIKDDSGVVYRVFCTLRLTLSVHNAHYLATDWPKSPRPNN